MLNNLYSYKFFLLKIAKLNLANRFHCWAEDIVQDTFVKAQLNYMKFDDTKGKFSSWLAKITVNLCMDFSKKKVNNEFNIEDYSSFNPNVLSENEHLDEFKFIRPCLFKINVRYRKALLLKYKFQMSAKEMAKYLNLPYTSVPVLIQRSKASLRNEINNSSFGNKLAA